jgi:hypothetical protein
MPVPELLTERICNVFAIAFKEPAHRPDIERVHVKMDVAAATAADGFRHTRRQDHLALVDNSRHGAWDRPGANVKGGEASKCSGRDASRHTGGSSRGGRAQGRSEEGRGASERLRGRGGNGFQRALD